MTALLNFILGLVLRIGLPLLVTLGFFYLLRRLDERWQKEARSLPMLKPEGAPCWESKGCSEEKRKACVAFNQTNVPCWQAFRARDGVMKEACLGCEVFRRAHVPVQA